VKPFDIQRPWGGFRQFTLNEPTTVKILRIKAGKRVSLQRHHEREEFWHIISGTGKVIVEDKIIPVSQDEEITVPTGATHRLEAGTEDLVFLEIAKGHFVEDDIERIADDYGRE